MTETVAVQAEKHGSGKAQLGLREQLLEYLLIEIAIAKSHPGDNFAESLESGLWANEDLKYFLLCHRRNCLIAQRKILGSIPRQHQQIIKDFIREFLLSGGNQQ